MVRDVRIQPLVRRRPDRAPKGIPDAILDSAAQVGLQVPTAMHIDRVDAPERAQDGVLD